MVENKFEHFDFYMCYITLSKSYIIYTFSNKLFSGLVLQFLAGEDEEKRCSSLNASVTFYLISAFSLNILALMATITVLTDIRAAPNAGVSSTPQV